MADIEKMKINLGKNEEKLAKKIALLGKYERKKAKLSAQWEKLYNESFNDSMNKIYSLEEDNLSTYGKLVKYYGEDAYDIYDKLYSFTRDEDYWNPINQTKKGIEELERMVQSYKDKIADEEKKIADRKASMESNTNGKDVNVIVEFLNDWERKVTEHFMKVFDKYVNEAESWYEENVKSLVEYKFENQYHYNYDELDELWKNSEYVEYYPTWREYNRLPYYQKRNDACHQKINEILSEKNELYVAIFSPNVIEKYAETKYKPNRETFEKNMRKAIAKEKDRKYDQLIEDVERLVGQIVDMTNIKIGGKGDLEGWVVGTDGECELWTTVAGGFNENVIVNVKHGQVAHFRFYVRKRA